MNLVYEQHPGNQLCDALVNVLVHHLVDLLTQFVCEKTTKVSKGNVCLVYQSEVKQLINAEIVQKWDTFLQVTCDFSLLGFHELAHHTEDILATLRSSVRHVKVVQGHILYHLLLLVNIPLRQRHVLFSLAQRHMC